MKVRVQPKVQNLVWGGCCVGCWLCASGCMENMWLHPDPERLKCNVDARFHQA